MLRSRQPLQQWRTWERLLAVLVARVKPAGSPPPHPSLPAHRLANKLGDNNCSSSYQTNNRSQSETPDQDFEQIKLWRQDSKFLLGCLITERFPEWTETLR